MIYSLDQELHPLFYVGCNYIPSAKVSAALANRCWNLIADYMPQLCVDVIIYAYPKSNAG